MQYLQKRKLMNEEYMRSIVAYGSDEENLIEKFESLPNWKLKIGDIPGSYSHYLEYGDKKIYLDVKAKNVIKTVNIFPQDHTKNHPSFKKDILQSLSNDLSQCSIEYALNVSDSDKAKL